MTAGGPYELTNVYDRLVVEAGLFDYEALAATVAGELGDGRRALELCVGMRVLREARKEDEIRSLPALPRESADPHAPQPLRQD